LIDIKDHSISGVLPIIIRHSSLITHHSHNRQAARGRLDCLRRQHPERPHVLPRAQPARRNATTSN
jgi:hypothetical protein